MSVGYSIDRFILTNFLFAASNLVVEAAVADDMHPLQRFELSAMPTTAPRAKRVTASLDAAARARIIVLPSSIDSSGTEPDAATLSILVNEYIFEAETSVSAATVTVNQDSDGKEDDGDRSTISASAADVAMKIRGFIDPASGSDELRCVLTTDVMEAVNGLQKVRSNRPAFRRAVMSCLRDRGHDAGLCKLRWDKSSSMAAGNYEYIDVVVSAETRFIVDVGFAAEFAVARPTAEFDAVHAALPEVLVASTVDVRRVVKAAAAAARRSLKSRGLSVPPWRKRRYVMAKWFGPYKRTVNPVPVCTALTVVGSGARAAICGTILGFAPRQPTVVYSVFSGSEMIQIGG